MEGTYEGILYIEDPENIFYPKKTLRVIPSIALLNNTSA